MRVSTYKKLPYKIYMANIELCHFGDHCEPGILIDDILKLKKKGLFMLGVYEFNNILSYLNENNLEKIYSKEHLIVLPDNNVRHGLYNFVFNHDYVINNSEVLNYDFVCNRFDLKIKNFREMLTSENTCVFITFAEDVDHLKIDDMLNWLSINKNKFHLIIYTNNPYTKNYSSTNLSIIVLEHSYHQWYAMDSNTKGILYKEIYDKFLNCLQSSNIEHSLPLTFEETNFGK